MHAPRQKSRMELLARVLREAKSPTEDWKITIRFKPYKGFKRRRVQDRKEHRTRRDKRINDISLRHLQTSSREDEFITTPGQILVLTNDNQIIWVISYATAGQFLILCRELDLPGDKESIEDEGDRRFSRTLYRAGYHDSSFVGEKNTSFNQQKIRKPKKTASKVSKK